jgi:HAD superfamily hydrolase (TIGR01459 family)
MSSAPQSSTTRPLTADVSVISGLGEIAERYDVVFCDVWGVIHNGRERFPIACEALSRFQQERGPVVLISNAPRPSRDVLPQLRLLKVPTSAWSGFVTSGDATFAELVVRAPGPAWHLGPQRDAALYEGSGVVLVDRPENAELVSCTGLFDDETETPEDYRARFEVCIARGLEMVCANPDRVVQRGDQMIYCGGALADLYAEMGGRVIMSGKPYAPIYAATAAEAGRLLGRRVDPGRVLCIGDGIRTDIKGANDQNLDVLFVTGGIHGAEAADAQGALDPAKVEAMLADAGAHARYAIQDLSW